MLLLTQPANSSTNSKSSSNVSASETKNEKNGCGRDGGRRRRKRTSRRPGEINYLELQDRRMRFNKASDPIYFVFDCLEKRSIPNLMKDFVKDSFFEVVKFVSKAAK